LKISLIIISSILIAETIATFTMFAGAQEEQNYFFTIHLALRAPFREEYT
jgi:hypothetical protein